MINENISTKDLTPFFFQQRNGSERDGRHTCGEGWTLQRDLSEDDALVCHGCYS